jgi:hypothetical protein
VTPSVVQSNDTRAASPPTSEEPLLTSATHVATSRESGWVVSWKVSCRAVLVAMVPLLLLSQRARAPRAASALTVAAALAGALTAAAWAADAEDVGALAEVGDGLQGKIDVLHGWMWPPLWTSGRI